MGQKKPSNEDVGDPDGEDEGAAVGEDVGAAVGSASMNRGLSGWQLDWQQSPADREERLIGARVGVVYFNIPARSARKLVAQCTHPSKLG